MAFNMAGVSVEASLEVAGTVLQLDDDVNGFKSIPRRVIQSISEITIVTAANNMSTISLTLTPDRKDAMDILRSGIMGFGLAPKTADFNNGDGQKTGVVRIKVRLGYDGGNDEMNRSPWYVGALTIPDLDLGSEDVRMTMNANTALVYAGMTDGLVVFEGTALDFVQAIAAILNVTVSNTKDDAGDIETILGAKQEKFVFNADLLSMLTDVLYNKNVEFHFDSIGEDAESATETLVLSAKKTKAARPPRWQFVMYKQIQPGIGIIPLTGIQISGTVLALNGAAFGAQALSIDSDLKESKIADLDDEDFEQTADKIMTKTGVKVLSAGTVPTKKPQFNVQSAQGGGGLSEPTSNAIKLAGAIHSCILRSVSKEDSRQDVKAKVAYSFADALSITCMAPGLPGIRIGEKVDLRIADLEDVLSGPGTVVKITHTINTEFNTEVVLNRAAGMAKPADVGVQTDEQTFTEGDSSTTIQPSPG